VLYYNVDEHITLHCTSVKGNTFWHTILIPVFTVVFRCFTHQHIISCHCLLSILCIRPMEMISTNGNHLRTSIFLLSIFTQHRYPVFDCFRHYYRILHSLSSLSYEQLDHTLSYLMRGVQLFCFYRCLIANHDTAALNNEAIFFLRFLTPCHDHPRNTHHDMTI
jgi:hypothetical protein